MKKTRLNFYRATLALLLLLYYSIGDIFYSTISSDGLPLLMIVYVVGPLTLVLALLRLWLLRPVKERQRLLNIPYFVIPVLTIIACYPGWVCVGIILSALAGVLIMYDLVMSVTKTDSLLVKHE